MFLSSRFLGKYIYCEVQSLLARVIEFLPATLLALDLAAPDELAVALLVLHHHLISNDNGKGKNIRSAEVK